MFPNCKLFSPKSAQSMVDAIKKHIGECLLIHA